MVTKIFSLGFSGIEVYPVEIEVDLQRGLPAVSFIGLLDACVKESKDRIRSAIKNSGFDFPAGRITVNLAPANVKKEGAHFDLAIALGVIASSHQANLNLSGYFIAGELSLEGGVRPVKGIFPMALEAKKLGKKIILPLDNAKEASLAKGLEIYPVTSLAEVAAFLSEQIEIKPFKADWQAVLETSREYEVDFSEVKGQLVARRASEVAVAGMHNLIMIGPPGVGKTMLAKRLSTILPSMSFDEILEVTRIYSIGGYLSSSSPVVKDRPFRAPHHTSSGSALVGGGTGNAIGVGEITLAHRGVLFLDELPEFHRDVLEALRQPLEDGFINVSRAAKHFKFPAKFLFASAMNPCPCGFFGSKEKACHCSSFQIQKYRRKISGPLLDRIDIHIELAGIKTRELIDNDFKAESSAEIKQRVEKARLIQGERFKNDKILFNSQMNHKQIKKYCILDTEAKNMLEMAIKHFSFSARAYDKILKVSRTIADLAERSSITAEDVAEAVQYRSLDKNLWV